MKSLTKDNTPSKAVKRPTPYVRPALNTFNYNLVMMIEEADWLDVDSLELDELS